MKQVIVVLPTQQNISNQTKPYYFKRKVIDYL